MGYLSSRWSAIMDPKKHRGKERMAKSPNRLSASEAVLRMAQKRLRARDLVEACLDRIEAREGQVHAWEALDPEGARKRADMLDKRSRPVGPLHGIPLAVKDIISTRTMPTTCGSPIYRDHVVGKDAACVTQLVKAGAIVLGKAVTTEFAGAHAGKTHNPHNLRHTPAGSSSGSAAAVADFMAPVGYGTQTAGSVIRPGAFNGVVAYKGSYGWADMTGIKPYAPSLDTLGFFAREANDLALIRAAYGHAPADPPPRQRAAHRPDAHAVVGDGRALQQEEHRGGRARPARRRRPGARMEGARYLGGSHAGAASHHDQGGDAVLCQGTRALLPSLLADHECRDGRGRRRESAAICRRQEAQAHSARASSTTPGRNSTCCWRPRPRARRRRGWAIPAIRSSTASGPFWARPASRCPSTPGRSACRLSVQLIGPRGRDDQLIAWARWVERKLA